MPRRSAPKTPEPDLEVDAADTNELVDGIEIGPDAEFFAAPDDLRGKARPKRARAGELDPIEAAEAAVARMADRFDDWMAEETSRLVTLFAEADETEFDGEALEAFHRAAHDIKGQAATLGFPIAGRIAASLCRLIEAKLETGRLPRELVQQHVLSVRAIIVEQAREDESSTARRLADRLDEVTHDYLEQIGHAA
ncbi:MAG: Hpt domain-containing protein [Hyphomicrobiales bacterium]|nr:Hpt domain-containing protein [Hyphomicrobiales bacterium]